MSNETDDSNSKQRDGADKSVSNVADSASQALFNDYYESTQGQNKANSGSDSSGKSGGSTANQESGTLEIPSLAIDSDKGRRGDGSSGEGHRNASGSAEAERTNTASGVGERTNTASSGAERANTASGVGERTNTASGEAERTNTASGAAERTNTASTAAERTDGATGEAQQSNGASVDAAPNSSDSIIRDPNAPRPPRNTELWPDMTKEREQRRESATQDIVDSVLNNGAFPADMAQHLAGFAAGRGYDGDVAGLNDFVRNINDRLRAAGSDYRLDVSEHRRDNLDLRDSSFMAGYTDHTVSLVRGVDRSPIGSVSIRTSVTLRPGVRS